jgi:hypothetical protein
MVRLQNTLRNLINIGIYYINKSDKIRLVLEMVVVKYSEMNLNDQLETRYKRHIFIN